MRYRRPSVALATLLACCLLILAVPTVGCSAMSSGGGSAGGNSSGGPAKPQSEFSDHSVKSIPASEADFVALRDQWAVTPEGAGVAFVVALEMYARNPELGLVALARMMDRDGLTDGDPPRLTVTNEQRFEQYVAARPYLAHHNFREATPDNGYEMGPGPYTVQIKVQPGDVQDATAKVFVVGTGADSPRPLTLTKNNRGLWKVKEYSSFWVGVRPPPTVEDDDY